MDDLSAYIDRAEKGDPQSTVLGLLKDLASGKVKHEDVFAHYKRKHMPTLNAQVEAFGQGRLFAAQTQDFTTWLRGDGWRKDYQVGLDFLATQDLCRVKVAAVIDFWHKMVQPSPGARKHMAERAGGEDELSRQWGMRTVKEGWRW
jgi:hypothetical protein